MKYGDFSHPASASTRKRVILGTEIVSIMLFDGYRYQRMAGDRFG
jgi:hypothetical protein